MSTQPDKTGKSVAEPSISIGRIIVGQLIYLGVMFIILYPALLTVSGGNAYDVYAAQRTLLLTTGGFVLQFAYMTGFRASRNKYSLISEYMTTALITITMATSVYVYFVEEGQLAGWAYWLLIVGTVSVTLVPVAFNDFIRARKVKD